MRWRNNHTTSVSSGVASTSVSLSTTLRTAASAARKAVRAALSEEKVQRYTHHAQPAAHRSREAAAWAPTRPAPKNSPPAWAASSTASTAAATPSLTSSNASSARVLLRGAASASSFGPRRPVPF